MKKKKSSLSIRIFYVSTHVIFWICTLVFVAVILFNIALQFGAFQENLQLHVQFPVAVDFLEKGSLNINDTNIDVEIVEASGKIHFFDTPPFLAKRFMGSAIPALILIFFILWMFKKFISDVKKEKIFDVNNISRLKKIAYGIFGLWIYTIVYMRIIYYYIAKEVNFEQIKISEDQGNFAGLLILSLFIWVLAHIFTVGLKIQEENKLTI